jgi:hypothetical protein
VTNGTDYQSIHPTNPGCKSKPPGGGTVWAIGANPSGTSATGGNERLHDTDVYSIRLYSQPLTLEQIKHNAEVDQNRFIAPPTVTIDGRDCTNLVIISETELRCRTPAMDTGTQAMNTPYDVEVAYNGATVKVDDAFTYKDFTLTSVSPNRGPLAGGNTISIFGENLPYINTSDYVQDGLVAHYDSINNIGLGDKFHDNNATIWKDLSGNGNDCTLSGDYAWANNRIYQAGSTPSSYWQGNCATPKINITNDYTAEIALIANSTNQKHESIYTSTYMQALRNWCRDNTSYPCEAGDPPGLRWRFGFDNNTVLTNSIDGQTMATIAVAKDQTSITSFVDATANNQTAITPVTNLKNNINLIIGPKPANTEAINQYYAIRIYNRALSQSELSINAELDRVRYLQAPEVYIGGDSSGVGGLPCTNVAVISPNELRCTVPDGTSFGVNNPQNVTVTQGGHTQTISDGYTYVNDFYIFDQSINHGTPGNEINFTGGQLDQVTAITIGGEACQSITNQTPTTLTCKVPVQTDYTNNTKDIVFTTTDPVTYPNLTLQQAWTYDDFITLNLDNLPDLTIDPSSSTGNTIDLNYTVDTNYHLGYSAFINTSNTDPDYTGHPNDLLCTAYNPTNYFLTALDSIIPTQTLDTNTWAYKPTGSNDWLNPQPTTARLKAPTTGPTTPGTPDQASITFGAKVDTTQPACGSYSGQVVVTVVGEV